MSLGVDEEGTRASFTFASGHKQEQPWAGPPWS